MTDHSIERGLPMAESVASLVEQRSVAGRKFYHRSIEQLHKTVSMLTNYVWSKQLRPGEHMWSIPVDQERDFDCILTDAIDELQELREAASRLSSPDQLPVTMSADRLDAIRRGDVRECGTPVSELLAEVDALHGRLSSPEPLREFCQSEGPYGETICMLPLGHNGRCGWEKLGVKR